jgi:hypothetical protein
MSDAKDYACPGEPFEPFGNWPHRNKIPGSCIFVQLLQKVSS